MNYGKCLGNPVHLTSRNRAMKYLDHLVTEKGYHILYHRCNSSSRESDTTTDHFEIMTGEGEYDDLFFHLNHDTDFWIPPEGYLFVPEIELKLLDHPEYDHCYTAIKEIIVAEQFIFRQKDTGDWEENMEWYGNLPPLERYLFYSFGKDVFVENFPFPLIEETLDNLEVMVSPAMKEWIVSAIKPREIRI